MALIWAPDLREEKETEESEDEDAWHEEGGEEGEEGEEEDIKEDDPTVDPTTIGCEVPKEPLIEQASKKKKQEPNQENKEVPPKKDAVVEPGTGSKKGGDEKGVTRVDSAVPAESVPSAPVKKPGETASGAANASASAGNLVELCVVVTRIETHSEVVYLNQMSSWCVQA